MAIQFEDFEPRVIQEAGFLKHAEYESIDSALEDANLWISQNNVHVLNVETVVLPNMHDKREEGTKDPSLPTPADFYSTWHQFIRVWYQA